LIQNEEHIQSKGNKSNKDTKVKITKINEFIKKNPSRISESSKENGEDKE
jgi:hypothetical protein